jgi:hypothetical protein
MNSPAEEAPMTRVQLPLALCCALAAAGCGRRPAPEPEAKVESPSAPTANPDPTPKPSPKRSPRPAPKPPSAVHGAYNESDAKTQLRKIALALMSVEATHGYYPAGIVGPGGDLGLSWRVAILPYLEDKQAQELYKEFKLAEAWDGPHNKKLLAKMPAVFATPGTAASEGRTHYRAFAGPGAFIPLPERAPADVSSHWRAKPGQLARGRALSSITDGTHNTLMVVQASEPVEWTRPGYLTYTDETFPKLGLFQKGFLGIMCDGTAHSFSEKVTEKSLRALASTHAGDFPGPEVNIFGLTRPKQ